jgi:hypothetical protein
MRESNSAKADSISFSSTVQFFTPPSPQSNRARELHHSVRPRRRLFSSGGERHNNQELNHAELDDILNDPVVIRNLFNEESWAPVEGQFSAESSGSYCSPVEDQVPEGSNGSFWAPVEDHVPAESNDSYSLHNQTENRYSSVPSRVPYNLDSIQNNSENGNYDSLEQSVTPYNLEDALQNFLGQSNEEDLIWETGSKDTQFEGLNNGSWSDDDDFDGRFFDTSAWKPHTVSDQQWRVLEAISQGKSVFVTGSAGTGKSYLLEFAAIENGLFQQILDENAGDWPLHEALELAILGLKCAEFRRRDRPDLEKDILPELERFKALVVGQTRYIREEIDVTPPNHFFCPILQVSFSHPGFIYLRKRSVTIILAVDRTPISIRGCTHLSKQNLVSWTSACITHLSYIQQPACSSN